MPTHYVEMQQTEFFGFAHAFPEEDALAIQGAAPNRRFELSNGWGTLHADGDVILTFGSEKGCRHYCLNYAELCGQLSAAEPDDA